MVKKAGVAFFAAVLLCVQFSFPCTVAVVSGKATQDGRPLLWKNRDTSYPGNKLVFLKGAKYSFIGLIDIRDKKAVNVWEGVNSEGFAIMNSASSDLKEGPEASGDNGRFMRMALGTCADIEQFELLLANTAGKRHVSANYGVIDARGNACFYESRSSSFVKFDANDPRVAPSGFIVRTNYAFTAPLKNGGGGYIRFERASRLFQAAANEQRLTVRFILQEAARDLANEKLQSYPLSRKKGFDSSSPLYINTTDTINRNTTAAVTVFQGAPRPEKAYLTTMWIQLGQAVPTAAVPVWVRAGNIPAVLGGAGDSALNKLSLKVRAFLYPDQRGHMAQYMNINRLLFGLNGSF